MKLLWITPTEHARVIYNGACSRNAECLRRFAWVAYNCKDEDVLLKCIEQLAELGDKDARVYMEGKRKLEKKETKFSVLGFYCLIFWTKDGSPYDPVYSKIAYSLFRCYSDNVGFFEEEKKAEVSMARKNG